MPHNVVVVVVAVAAAAAAVLFLPPFPIPVPCAMGEQKVKMVRFFSWGVRRCAWAHTPSIGNSSAFFGGGDGGRILKLVRPKSAPLFAHLLFCKFSCSKFQQIPQFPSVFWGRRHRRSNLFCELPESIGFRHNTAPADWRAIGRTTNFIPSMPCDNSGGSRIFESVVVMFCFEFIPLFVCGRSCRIVVVAIYAKICATCCFNGQNGS